MFGPASTTEAPALGPKIVDLRPYRSPEGLYVLFLRLGREITILLGQKQRGASGIPSERVGGEAPHLCEGIPEAPRRF